MCRVQTRGTNNPFCLIDLVRSTFHASVRWLRVFLAAVNWKRTRSSCFECCTSRRESGRDYVRDSSRTDSRHCLFIFFALYRQCPSVGERRLRGEPGVRSVGQGTGGSFPLSHVPAGLVCHSATFGTRSPLKGSSAAHFYSRTDNFIRPHRRSGVVSVGLAPDYRVKY